MLFPHVLQQFPNKTKEDHQQSIEEKDVALALLNDDLQNREYEKVTLQPQRDAYQAQLQKCQDQICDLIINHDVSRENDPGKANIIMITKKSTALEEDEFCQYPYYIARIQWRFISTKRRWFRVQYPHHKFIIKELDNANCIHAFNQFEEEGHVERYQCHFRLVDLAHDALYALVTPAILDDDEEEWIFMNLMGSWKTYVYLTDVG